MIDRRHPDGSLRVLISCLSEMLYPPFSSFFFRFKISVFRSCMRIIFKYTVLSWWHLGGLFILSRRTVRELKNWYFCLRVIYLWISSHELANFACDLIPPCRKSEALWYVVNTAQLKESLFFRDILFIYMYENTIRITRPHTYMHVNPCRAVKLRETSMLVHLQIISAKAIKLPKAN